MKLVAAAILVLAVAVSVVGWRMSQHHRTCGGGIGPAMACK